MKWKEKGYRLALQVTNKDSIAKDYADFLLITVYTTLTDMFNKLLLSIPQDYDLVTACCDETYPNSNHTAIDVIKIYYSYFPDGFGVLSPKGDRFGSNISVQNPIVDKKWADKFGILPLGYNHYYADTELYYRAKKLGRLIEDNNINYYHDHWSRKSKILPKHLEKANKLNGMDRELYKTRIKEIDNE